MACKCARGAYKLGPPPIGTPRDAWASRGVPTSEGELGGIKPITGASWLRSSASLRLRGDGTPKENRKKDIVNGAQGDVCARQWTQ